jgi:hypothetical protein
MLFGLPKKEKMAQHPSIQWPISISAKSSRFTIPTNYDKIVNQNKIAEFEKLKGKYAETDEVLICETMPSIEFWFLLHFL